jgi:pimeloyl-ACP methyl ester carboxylesterase
MSMLGGRIDAFFLARARWPEHAPGDGTRWVETSQVRFRVRELGRGPLTILIAPDPPNVIEHYHALLPRLAEHARVICFEPPGFGFSHPKTHAFGFRAVDHADAMTELLDALAVKDATLTFSCLAAYVGLMIARRRPDLIARCVLSQIPSHEDMVRWAKRFDYLRSMSTAGVGQALIRLTKPLITRAWYTVALPKHRDVRGYTKIARDAQRAGAAYPLASGIQALHRFRPDDVAGVAQETTVIWGAADPSHAASDPQSVRALVPHARLVVFERCGHFPDLEETDRWIELVLGR